MTNIQLKGKKEIDLLAINPITRQYYHIESRISTTFKLREKATITKRGTSHRDGLDYFQKEKFEPLIVKQKIREVFGDVPYQKVLVVWDTKGSFTELSKIAEQQYGIEIMSIKEMVVKFTHDKVTSGSRDDVLRVFEFVYLTELERKRLRRRIIKLGERKT